MIWFVPHELRPSEHKCGPTGTESKNETETACVLILNIPYCITFFLMVLSLSFCYEAFSELITLDISPMSGYKEPTPQP